MAQTHSLEWNFYKFAFSFEKTNKTIYVAIYFIVYCVFTINMFLTMTKYFNLLKS